jgi:hypothetical protein
MRILVVISIIFFIASCNSKNGIVSVPIEDDFSHIANPKERWEAYQLSNYEIVQRRSCECIGLEYTARIVNNSVQKVAYEGEQSDEYTTFAKTNAITVDDAFDLIEEYSDEAYSITVDYHPRFGYPTKLIINIYEMIADEEIIYRMSDLKKFN